MSPRRIPARTVARGEYASRWRNAQDRLAAMERELGSGAHDPALILAVQAVIAASDALTIFPRVERSSADRHEDALAVLARAAELPGLPAARNHLAHLLRRKSEIEHSGRTPSAREVEALAQHARRFVTFVGAHLPPPAR